MTILITSTPQDSLMAKHLSQLSGIDYTPLKSTRFTNREFYIEAPETLTGKCIVYFHHNFCLPNEQVMQLALALNAIRQRNPKRLDILIPYLPYSRQERARNDGSAIGAALMGQLLGLTDPDTIMTLDLHSTEAIKYFKAPVINLSASDLIAQDIKRHFPLSDTCLVSLDKGGLEGVRKISEALSVPCMALKKERADSGDISIYPPSVLPPHKTYIFIDDIIDTGSTLLAAGKYFPDKEVHIYATHGLFSDAASFEKLTTCFKSITVTDSLPQTQFSPKLRIIPCWEAFLQEMGRSA